VEREEVRRVVWRRPLDQDQVRHGASGQQPGMPPLGLKESRNTHPCPIDCVIDEWVGQSGCSAECGGGIRESMRPVPREKNLRIKAMDGEQWLIRPILERLGGGKSARLA
jgi:hypothetical protein